MSPAELPTPVKYLFDYYYAHLVQVVKDSEPIDQGWVEVTNN
jgi:hypothetical protein